MQTKVKFLYVCALNCALVYNLMGDSIYGGFCVTVTIYILYLVISSINLIYLIANCCTLANLYFSFSFTFLFLPRDAMQKKRG